MRSIAFLLNAVAIVHCKHQTHKGESQLTSEEPDKEHKVEMHPVNVTKPVKPSNETNWNGGQGDNFGEPFRSQTGGDFRYKSGRTWGGDDDSAQPSWSKYAAPYSSVNPDQPGKHKSKDASPSDPVSPGGFNWQQFSEQGDTKNSTSDSSSPGGFNWQQYAQQGGDDSNSTRPGGFDWKQYAQQGGNSSNSTSQGGFNWQQYMGSSSSSSDHPAAGGYYEMEIEGKDLNVTTTFGLGQGSNVSAAAGGGGGHQTYLTAKEGKLFFRGNFLNQFGNTVPAQ
jgi:hypothetical protein